MNIAGTLFFGLLIAGTLIAPSSASPAPPLVHQAVPAYYVDGQAAQAPAAGPLSDVKQITACELPGYLRYTDHPYGYSLCVPGSMLPDPSLSAVSSVFLSESSRIEVYYDNFAGSSASPQDYTAYGNRFLFAGRRHRPEIQETFSWNGFTVHRNKWSRDPLAAVKNDRNHYASLELIRTPDECYTVFIKSSAPIDNDLDILRSFRLVSRQGAPGIFRQPAPSASRLNPETRAFRDRYFGPASPLRWGLFDSDAPDRLRSIRALEGRLGYKFSVVLRYQTLDETLPVSGLATAFADGRYTELTLQTIRADAVNALYEGSVRDNGEIVYDILDGRYDDYLREYAASLKKFGHPVLFRLNNEMNGDWCWYSALYTGKDTAMFRELWRHIRRIFDAAGVDNVLWVWNPHDVSLPDFKWNHPLMYYPGDDVVDVIGITGYNTGTYFPGERWRGFREIYKPVHIEYSAWFDKPFMITEFGSNSVGGDKVAWIDEMFREIGAYDRIKVAVWWSGVDLDLAGRPGRIYLLDENPPTEDAFRRGLQQFSKTR